MRGEEAKKELGEEMARADNRAREDNLVDIRREMKKFEEEARVARAEEKAKQERERAEYVKKEEKQFEKVNRKRAEGPEAAREYAKYEKYAKAVHKEKDESRCVRNTMKKLQEMQGLENKRKKLMPEYVKLDTRVRIKERAVIGLRNLPISSPERRKAEEQLQESNKKILKFKLRVLGLKEDSFRAEKNANLAWATYEVASEDRGKVNRWEKVSKARKKLADVEEDIQSTKKKMDEDLKSMIQKLYEFYKCDGCHN